MDRESNPVHDERMILLLAALLVLVVLTGTLARTVLRDGYGHNPAPRSHLAELDAWARR